MSRGSRPCRRLLLVAALAAAAGSLPPAGAQTSPDAQPPADIPAPGAPKVVRLPFPQEDGSLTPYTFELAYPLLTLVYDTLLWRDDDGVPQPWLANSVEESPDGRRVTVRLAAGARWHDGAPVTAADVAFTFGFVKERFHPRFSPQLRAVERVEASDEATAVFVLRQPSAGFRDQPLADVPILPAHLWRSLARERLAPDGLPVGSGPYRLVEHRPGASYRFEANAEYFRGTPAVAAIEVPVIRTVDETLRAMEGRRVDMLPVSLPEAAAARLQGGGARVVEGPSYPGTVLMFNLRGPPFDRPEFRRAVATALDLARISRITGQSVSAERGFIHPASPWAAPEPLHTFDLEAARQTSIHLGLQPFVVMAPNNDPAQLEAGRQVTLALQRAGIVATVKPVSVDELSRVVGEEGLPPSFQAAIWTSPGLASYDPDFLRTLFGSNPEEAPFNYSGYRSATFDGLAQRIATSRDPVARRSSVNDALRLLAEDVPAVPLLFAIGTFTYRPTVYNGWRFVKGTGILDKRSFVEPRPASQRGATELAAPTPAPTPTERPWLAWTAGALIAAGVTVAVVAVARR